MSLPDAFIGPIGIVMIFIKGWWTVGLHFVDKSANDLDTVWWPLISLNLVWRPKVSELVEPKVFFTNTSSSTFKVSALRRKEIT